MDEPKKTPTDPASSGDEAMPENLTPDPDSPPDELTPAEPGDSESAPNDSSPAAGRDTNPEDAGEDDASGDSAGTIEDSPGPYQDPYDPDGIYNEYDEFARDDQYAPQAEKMPERPDDPHIQETPDSEDRAESEAAAAGIIAPGNENKGGGSASSDKKKKSKSDDDDEEEDFFEERDRELGGRMSFLEHLDELRKRIFHALISVIVTFVAAWAFREQIFAFLSAPIKGVIKQLVVLRPTEPFTVYLKVSFTAAIFFAIPYIMYQVWLFIAPGLYRKEKVFALPFLFASTILFILGGMFAYYVILPPALTFLLTEFGSEFQPLISAIEFYDFEFIIIVGMGAIFQLPVVVAFLSMFGLVSPGFLWKNFRYAFLLITIFAAVVSPTTDPLNLFLWTGPMVILYIFSIGVSWIFKARRDRRKRLEEKNQ